MYKSCRNSSGNTAHSQVLLLLFAIYLTNRCIVKHIIIIIFYHKNTFYVMKQNTYYSRLMYLHLYWVITVWNNPKDPEQVFDLHLLGQNDV